MSTGIYRKMRQHTGKPCNDLFFAIYSAGMNWVLVSMSNSGTATLMKRKNTEW